MLKPLLGSQLRQDLLTFFLLKPEAVYTTSQIAKAIKRPKARLETELKNLSDFALLISVDKNKWLINNEFIILKELRALLAKAQLLHSQQFISGLSEVAKLDVLILSGVFTADEKAPTDLLLVGQVKRRPFLTMVNKLEKDLGREINYTIMDKSEYLFRLEVMDIFIHSFLQGRTLVLLNNLEQKQTETETLPLEPGESVTIWS